MVVSRQLQVLAVLSIPPGNRVCLDYDGEENIFTPSHEVELSCLTRQRCLVSFMLRQLYSGGMGSHFIQWMFSINNRLI